tara:strand:+ start:19025 stop:21100 length:2076 start_codon:yes stop_codon:yes gene_type:complete
MNLSILDWLIVFVCLAGMIFSVRTTKGLMKSVSDFLAAGRTAGRYVVSVSSGVAGLGAISIVMFLEMGYVSGFALAWWGLSQGIIILLITVSGWVIYRFRSTRCLTLPQFFEIRYSQKFRVFTGFIAFFSGIINFGIFPAVGARFFIHFCGLPESILGIPIFPIVMIFLLSIALYFVQTGGQIAVIIADFFQGVYVNIIFIVMIFFLLFSVGWDQVTEALEQTPIKLAEEEITDIQKQKDFYSLNQFEQNEKIIEIREKYENSSRINPFKTSHVEDFNFWYFLIGIIGIMYGTMSWQGSQAYNASAKSAHEAKMGAVLAGFRGFPQALFFLFVPIAIYVFMNHADYHSISLSVNTSLDQFNSDALRTQMRAPIVLSEVLPVGLMGAFAALMLAAFISTHDTYLHSWGSILVQDVIMPFRKDPFDKDTHLKVLRYSIYGVAVFIFFFSLLFQQNQKIALFFAITGAIFAGGAGAVIIGGLYWKRGTTSAAWSAMITGAVIAVSGIILKQISADWLADTDSMIVLKQGIIILRNINGQVYWAIGMGASALSYVLVSLFGKRSIYNMDRMLNRGEYAIKGEMEIVSELPERGWKMLGMGKEFTKGDKIIYIINYVWTLSWTIVFFAGTVHNLYNDVSDASWMNFWKYYLLIHIIMAVISIIWFTWGGFKDLGEMMTKLKSTDRDHKDNGWISVE